MPKNLELAYLIDFYGDMLTEKQREVMEQYYNDDLSLSEIAENFGITRQGVRDSIKRGEGILLDLEEKVGFAKRHRELETSMQELEALARDIAFRNKGGFGSVDAIDNDVKQILEVVSRLSDQGGSGEESHL